MLGFSLIEGLKALFSPTEHCQSLDEYIVAGNPQTTHDVERLEQEFNEKRKRDMMMFNHYTNFKE